MPNHRKVTPSQDNDPASKYNKKNPTRKILHSFTLEKREKTSFSIPNYQVSIYFSIISVFLKPRADSF